MTPIRKKTLLTKGKKSKYDYDGGPLDNPLEEEKRKKALKSFEHQAREYRIKCDRERHPSVVLCIEAEKQHLDKVNIKISMKTEYPASNTEILSRPLQCGESFDFPHFLPYSQNERPRLGRKRKCNYNETLANQDDEKRRIKAVNSHKWHVKDHILRNTPKEKKVSVYVERILTNEKEVITHSTHSESKKTFQSMFHLWLQNQKTQPLTYEYGRLF